MSSVAATQEAEESRDSAALTATQVSAFRKVYTYFDVDGNGVISAEEMHSRANELGMKITLKQVRAGRQRPLLLWLIIASCD